MRDTITDWLKNSKKGNRLILWLGIGGMALILLSEFWPADTSSKKQTDCAQNTTVYEYETQLEQRLENLIAQVDGAGKTVVMVTLESGEQSVFAVDTREGEAETEQTHVLLDDGSALTETVQTPAICGVAVVCEGGDQIHVISQVTEMLSSLLDLSTNRISVAKMN